MSTAPPRVERAAREFPAVAAAVKFVQEFQPREGVDYTWAAEYARTRYEFVMRAFDSLDARAATIIGHLGSGTGLITLGSVAGLATATVNPLVVGLAVPSLLCALIALVCAVRARAVEDVSVAPPVDTVLGRVQNDGGDQKVKGRVAAQYHLCIAILLPLVERKGADVKVATRYFGLAVAGLILPLLAMLGFKLLAH